jgi:hypothetical protein
MSETDAFFIQHTSAVRFCHLPVSSLLHISSETYFFKEIIHIKNYFANVATITDGMTATICAWLTMQHDIFRHFESKTVYKIIDV